MSWYRSWVISFASMETPSFLRIVLHLVLWALALLVVGGGVALWYWSGEVEQSRGRETGEISFVIGKGEGATTVAEKLERSGLIESKLPFLYYVMRSNQTNRLQSGEYRLSGTLSIPEIVERFVQGKVVPPGVRITFPEGFTAAMMAKRLTENNLPGDAFLAIVTAPYPKWRERYTFLQAVPSGKSLEGYLFPDTYIFPQQTTGELIVGELLKTFERKAQPLFAEYQGKTVLTPYESLILASIVEEEGKQPEERRIISDIFLKRLAINQPLQSDATVNYALGMSKMQPSLKDIETDSPYNTYKYPGLPPTPIASPGLESLRAALDPTPNEYYYFLNNLKTGETVFSRTFDEHVANREKHGL